MKRTLFITSPGGNISIKDWECDCNTEEELIKDFHNNNDLLEDYEVIIKRNTFY